MSIKRFKKLVSVFTALSLVFSMAFPVFAAEESKETSLVVVHTNDVHSRVDGEAYVSSYVKGLKAEGKNVLLISAGDVIHGQPFATISRGKSVVDVMNAAGYDFMTAGNHEFNYGYLRLKELEQSMNFDLLVANIMVKESNQSLFKKYEIREIDGVKVGFFGLATPETVTKTNPKNVVGLEFLKPVPVAEEMVKTLKAEGAEVIIAIAHLGVDGETLAEERGDAVAAVEGIDLVIDGHSHTELPEGKMVGNCLLVQTGEYLNNIGTVTLNIKDGKVISKKAELMKTPTAEQSSMAPDTAVTEVIEKTKVENEKITSEVIGKTPVKLEGAREVVRTTESNLANLITDAMMEATGADIAITNGGGVRASIEAGDITKGSVLTVLPFGNFICTVNVKGSAVLEALEHGVSAYPETAGHYSQVGGMKVTMDSTKSAGSRITSVKLNDGTALDPEKTYKLATNDFMVAGGDNYTMLAVTDGYMEYGSLDEALISYIASGADLTAVEMGRIADLKSEEAAEEVPATETPAEEVPVSEPAPEEEEKPVDEPAAAAEVLTDEYIVVSGDYLVKIAEKFNTTWRAIADLNKLANPHLIFPGQKLLLPQN